MFTYSLIYFKFILIYFFSTFVGIESGQTSLYLFRGTHDVDIAASSGGGTTIDMLHKSLSYPEWSEVIVKESQALGLLASCLLAVIVMSCKQLFISYGWIHHETSQPSRTVRYLYCTQSYNECTIVWIFFYILRTMSIHHYFIIILFKK